MKEKLSLDEVISYCRRCNNDKDDNLDYKQLIDWLEELRKFRELWDLYTDDIK